MRHLLTIAALTSLTGCVTDKIGITEPAGPAAGTCQNTNSALDRFVGQTVTSDLGAQLLKESGARVLRWGPPGSAMTMDFRADRLTVSYDANMVVTGVKCG